MVQLVFIVDLAAAGILDAAKQAIAQALRFPADSHYTIHHLITTGDNSVWFGYSPKQLWGFVEKLKPVASGSSGCTTVASAIQRALDCLLVTRTHHGLDSIGHGPQPFHAEVSGVYVITASDSPALQAEFSVRFVFVLTFISSAQLRMQNAPTLFASGLYAERLRWDVPCHAIVVKSSGGAGAAAAAAAVPTWLSNVCERSGGERTPSVLT